MERENVLMIATIICILGVIFLFKEMNKAKNDLDKLKEFSAHLIHQVTTPQPVPVKREEIEEIEENEVEEKNDK